jgi:Mg2+ and Co2+ transporter CorA
MKQPEALRLAHWLERDGANCQQHIDAGAELRRLHELNQQLVKALENLMDYSALIEDVARTDDTCDSAATNFAREILAKIQPTT